jgi:hypothetical protein
MLLGFLFICRNQYLASDIHDVRAVDGFQFFLAEIGLDFYHRIVLSTYRRYSMSGSLLLNLLSDCDDFAVQTVPDVNRLACHKLFTRVFLDGVVENI